MLMLHPLLLPLALGRSLCWLPMPCHWLCLPMVNPHAQSHDFWLNTILKYTQTMQCRFIGCGHPGCLLLSQCQCQCGPLANSIASWCDAVALWLMTMQSLCQCLAPWSISIHRFDSYFANTTYKWPNTNAVPVCCCRARCQMLCPWPMLMPAIAKAVPMVNLTTHIHSYFVNTTYQWPIRISFVCAHCRCRADADDVALADADCRAFCRALPMASHYTIHSYFVKYTTYKCLSFHFCGCAHPLPTDSECCGALGRCRCRPLPSFAHG